MIFVPVHFLISCSPGVALALKFTGSRKTFADPFKSAKKSLLGVQVKFRGSRTQSRVFGKITKICLYFVKS